MKGYRTYTIIALGFLALFILFVESNIDLVKYSQSAKDLTELFKDVLPMIMSGLAVWKAAIPQKMKHEQ